MKTLKTAKNYIKKSEGTALNETERRRLTGLATNNYYNIII